MKKVLLRRRKYGIKDLFRLLGLIGAHYLAFYIYFGILFAIHYAVNGEVLWHSESTLSWTAWYSLIAGPAVNAGLHAYYAERGSGWMRMVNWLHSVFMIVMVPIIEFT